VSRPKTHSGPDRREHPRAPADWNLTLRLADGDVEARLRDVSRRGLCFFVDRPLPELTQLAIEVDLPADAAGGGLERVRATGAIVRCERIADAVDHWEVAVFLHDIDEASAEAIDAFARSHT